MELNYDYIKRINGSGIETKSKRFFFTKNFLTKISHTLQQDADLENTIQFRLKAINRLKDKKQRDLIFEQYYSITVDEINSNLQISKKFLEIILNLENYSDNLKDFIQSIRYFNYDDNIGDNLLVHIFNKKCKKDDILRSIQFNEKISKNYTFQQYEDYFLYVLENEEALSEFYNVILYGLNKIHKIINENSIDIDIDVIDCGEYIGLEKFLEKIDLNFSGGLNKQDIAQKGLNPYQRTSWNRHMIERENLLSEEKLERLSSMSMLYIDFVNELSNDSTIRERLKEEIGLDDRLEEIYFRPISQDQVFRIDATYGDYNSIYEFDDFPRGIAMTYGLDLYYKQESGWSEHIRNILEDENDVFVFLIHDEASGACKHEHKEMARLLNENDGINVIYVTSSEFKQKAKSNYENKGVTIDGYNVKGVWHHLMMTQEAGDILPYLDQNDVKILPHFHVSSHKGINSILWEIYQNGTLDSKYYPLIDEGFFPETINITHGKQGFTFQGIDYESFENFISRNSIQDLKNVVIKIVGAENAEGVNVFATLTNKQLKKRKQSLLEYIEGGLEEGSSIVLQENKPHTILSTVVYNSKDDTYEIFEGNFINRIFFDGNGNFISGISQITKPSVVSDVGGTKKGYGTAHGMVDMVMTSI